MAPVNRRTQSLVPGQCTAVACAEEVERVAKALGNLVYRHHLRPRRSQLDRKRDPAEAMTDFCNRGRVLLGQLELRARGANSLDEQAGTLCRDKVFAPDRVIHGWKCERWHAPCRFTQDIQCLPAGCQHAEMRAAAEQPRGQLRTSHDEMLTVVKHDQALSGRE